MNKVKEALPKELGFWERNRRSHNYLIRRETKKIFISVARALLLFGLIFLILQPIATKIGVSLMEEGDLYDSSIVVIPKHFTTENYKLDVYLMDYWNALAKTFGISFTVALIQLISSALVAYGFARFDFPLKKLWFTLVILVIIIPPQTISTSLFLHFRYFDILGIFKLLTGDTLNIRGSAIPYYMMCAGCMGLKQGLYIFLLRQMFQGIPKELEEAACVDGCGPFRTFVRVMLPNAVPTLLSCFLFSFVWQWTDNFYNQMFLGNANVLAKKLVSLLDDLGHYISGNNSTSVAATITVGYGQMMISTGILMAVVPLIILYLFAQKGFIENLSATGIKM